MSVPFFWSGFLGVDIFFVISGYVITASLESRSTRDGAVFLLGFYERRIKRLSPALICCMLATTVCLCMFDPMPQVDMRTGQAALFGLSNAAIYTKSLDYFGNTSKMNPFTQTWSLGVEEQFYFLFPLLAWVSGFGSGAEHGRKRLAVMVSAFASLSMLCFAHWQMTDTAAAYFLMPARFWELSSGCLLFLFKDKLPQGPVPFWVPDGALLALSVMYCLPPAWRAVTIPFTVCLTCAFIHFVSPVAFVYPALTHKSALYIGRISYSLYLWHWAVLSIARRTDFTPDERGDGTPRALILCLHWLLILALSHASYSFIERPFRQAVWSSWKGVSVMYGVIAMSATLGFLMKLERRPDLTQALFLGKFCMPGHKETCTNQKSIHVEIFPSIEQSNINPLRCFMGLRYTGLMEDTMRECTRRTPQSKQQLFVYGDSYAAHLSMMVNGLLKQHPLNLLYLPVEGCEYDTTGKMHRKEPEAAWRSFKCNSINKVRSKYIEKYASRGDIVMLSSRRWSLEKFVDTLAVGHIDTDSDPPEPPGSQYFPEEQRLMFRQEAKRAKKRGYFLVLHTPIPQIEPLAQQHFLAKQLECELTGTCAYLCKRADWFASRNFRRRRACDREWVEDYNVLLERGRKREVIEFFQSLKEEFPENVFVWDLDEYLCHQRGDKRVCSTHDENGRLYSDWAGHLSLYANLKLTPHFINFFESEGLIAAQRSN